MCGWLAETNYSTLQDSVRRDDSQVASPGLFVVPETAPGPAQLDTAPVPMDVDLPMAEYGRGLRGHKPVKRYKDFTATSTIPFAIPSTLPDAEEAQPSLPPANAEGEKDVSPFEVLRRTILDDRSWKRTPANQFGLYKKFWTLESRPHDPDSFITSEDLREEEEEEEDEAARDAGTTDISNVNILHPFPNWSSFHIGEWFWDDSQEKGRESFKKLISILTSEDFSTQEIRAANWDKINQSLAASQFDDYGNGFDWADDGMSWQTAVVQVEVPFNKTSLRPGVHHYEVPNFRYRPLVPIITERLKDATRGEHFHIVPSELRWRPGGDSGPDVHVYGELYNSPAFLEAYKEVQVRVPLSDFRDGT